MPPALDHGIIPPSRSLDLPDVDGRPWLVASSHETWMMVTNICRPTLDEPALVRRSASHVLSQLLEGRAQIEAKLVELGRIDPIKCVTGLSSIERAINDTRSMLQDMDKLAATELDEFHDHS